MSERFIVGDLVESEKGETGEIVMSYPRKSDGKMWPMVKITNNVAGREGQRVWTPGFHALIDHEGFPPYGHNKQVCERCGRTFYGPQGLCRTHDRMEAAEYAQTQRDPHAGPSHGFGTTSWTRRGMRRHSDIQE